MAVSIASGQPFLGKYPVSEPGPVLIVQQEDFNAQTAERNALITMARMNIPAPVLEDDYLDVPVMPTDKQLPLYFHAERQLRFDDTEVMDALEEFVKEIRPKLVIVDPLYQATPIDDYMAKAVEHMSRLKNMRKDYGTSFLIVHHTKKDADTWDRTKLWGSQLLNAFGETTIHVRRPEGEAFTLVHRHFKADAMPAFLKLSWDIRMSDYHYSVAVEEVSKDEADRLLVGKGGNGNGAENVSTRPKGLAKKILDALANAPEPMSLQDLAFDCGSDQAKLAVALQKLVESGDVRENDDGLWVHSVPDVG
jgi:hypothetical protein